MLIDRFENHSITELVITALGHDFCLPALCDFLHIPAYTLARTETHGPWVYMHVHQVDSRPVAVQFGGSGDSDLMYIVHKDFQAL